MCSISENILEEKNLLDYKDLELDKLRILNYPNIYLKLDDNLFQIDELSFWVEDFFHSGILILIKQNDIRNLFNLINLKLFLKEKIEFDKILCLTKFDENKYDPRDYQSMQQEALRAAKESSIAIENIYIQKYKEKIIVVVNKI